MDWGSLSFSGAALIVSIFSFYFSIKSWRESNRPIVTVRVTTNSGGNVGSALDLIVENTGNRPAKNIKLSIEPENLKSALLVNAHEQLKEQIKNCFSDRGIIPMLANGKSVSNSFGFLSRGQEQEDWVRNSRFDISVSYEDVDSRKYKHQNPILIADDKGFAGGYWESSK
jgi:hypothetical protein